jgi:acyl-coenzyme A thioesterase PaaI-like protein
VSEPAWRFGVEPLPQTVEAARLLRTIAGQLLSLETAHPEVDELLGQLRAAEARLAELVPSDPRPRVGPAAATASARVYLDHARDIGAFDPCFPEYQLTVDGDRATGTVRFPVAYEGPPGLVHGGFLAVFFDCAIQHHSCDVGVAGKTTSLSLRYRRPTPLDTDLQVELTRSVTDGRISASGELRHGDELLCTASMEMVAGVRDRLPEVSPRRLEP